MIGNLPKWILLSVTKHFQDALKNEDFEFSTTEDFDDLVKHDRVELRFDGPYFKELSKGYYEIYFEVNFLLSVNFVKTVNRARLQEIQGKIVSALTDITIYKLGDKPEDDGSQIACFSIKSGYREHIQITNYGVVEKDTRLQQSTVEAHYLTKQEL